MSWSLQLRNGDLVHHNAQFATVEGPAKLAQDLRCQLLERMGTDDMHPGYGSLIDGGQLPDGTEVEGVITSTDWNAATLEIESEIRRIEREYQARQLERIEDDVQRYGRTTLRRDEILSSISAIQFTQVGDTLFVALTINPASGTPEILDLPVGTL